MTSSYAAVKERRKKKRPGIPRKLARLSQLAKQHLISSVSLRWDSRLIPSERPAVGAIVRVCVRLLIAVNGVKSFKRQKNIYVCFLQHPPQVYTGLVSIRSQQSPGW